MSALFVTFEGQDGSGKSKLLRFVTARLKQIGLAGLIVPEFSSRVVGRFLQETLVENKFIRLNGPGPSALTETLYILSDLYSQDEFEIKPALHQGAIVVKERHLDSILACQLPKIMGDYPANDAEQIFQWLHCICSQLTVPDLTIFLRVSDEELRKRIKARGEQATTNDFAVFRNRQTIYDRLAAENQHRWFEVINDGNPQDTMEIILGEIIRRLTVH